MGNNPTTLSPCPFPFTAYPIENVTSASQCTRTYAEAYGSAYQAVRITTLVIGWFAFTVLLARLVALVVFAARSKRKLRTIPVVPFIVLSCLASLCIGLDSIDMWGMSNLIPMAFYSITDRLAQGLMILVILYLVDFWLFLRKMGNQGSYEVSSTAGLPPRLFKAMVIMTLTGSLFIEIVAVCVPSHYFILSGLGYIIEASIIFILIVFASHALYDVTRTLKQNAAGRNTNHQQATDTSYGSSLVARGSSITTTIGNSAPNSSSKNRILNQLRLKFGLFLIAATCACVYLFTVAGAYYTLELHSPWKMPFAPDMSAYLVLGRVVVCIVLLCFVTMFTLPPTIVKNYTFKAIILGRKNEQQRQVMTVSPGDQEQTVVVAPAEKVQNAAEKVMEL